MPIAGPLLPHPRADIHHSGPPMAPPLPQGDGRGVVRPYRRPFSARLPLAVLFLGGAVLGAVADVMPGERHDGLMLGVGHFAHHLAGDA